MLLEHKSFDGMQPNRKEQLRKLINRFASYKSKNNGAGLTPSKKAELASEFSGFLGDIPDQKDLQKIKNIISWLGGNAAAAQSTSQAQVQPANSNTQIEEVPSTEEIQDDQAEQQGDGSDSAEDKPNPYAKWDLGLKSPREILADLNKPKVTPDEIFDRFLSNCAQLGNRLRFVGLSPKYFEQAKQVVSNVYVLPICVLDNIDVDDDLTVDDIKNHVAKLFAKPIKQVQNEFGLTEKTPFSVSAMKDNEDETVICIAFDARNF